MVSLRGDNTQLDELLCHLQEKYQTMQSQVDQFVQEPGNNIPQTTHGNKFSKEIRCLYYSLLASQIPPNRIKPAIRAVIKVF